ncbi:hypothetical protein PGIGA_G00200020 [Pangasianodon gigas]|uniref:Uncharacterized protein n=1 Tax=Pangasianodon gigas TaxID=30993 RepID=A0ACC5WEJ0_PANGG|nr:hypothetical protein [Pangasianodon gigas]
MWNCSFISHYEVNKEVTKVKVKGKASKIKVKNTGGSKWLNLHHKQKAEEGAAWKNHLHLLVTPAVSCLKSSCCVRSVWMCSLIQSPLHVDTTSARAALHSAGRRVNTVTVHYVKRNSPRDLN